MGIISGGKVIEGAIPRAAAATEDVGTQATVSLGVIASNNAIRYTAVTHGDEGNAITVAHVDPPGNNVALSVDVDGRAIEVTLATDVSSVPTSTAAQVIAAVLEHDTASQLVTAANSGASNGTGVVAAAAATPLAGGLDY